MNDKNIKNTKQIDLYSFPRVLKLKALNAMSQLYDSYPYIKTMFYIYNVFQKMMKFSD